MESTLERSGAGTSPISLQIYKLIVKLLGNIHVIKSSLINESIAILPFFWAQNEIFLTKQQTQQQ